MTTVPSEEAAIRALEEAWFVAIATNILENDWPGARTEFGSCAYGLDARETQHARADHGRVGFVPVIVAHSVPHIRVV